MSHLPERKEKDCLNCGTIVHGRFCHVCGQENLEPKETVWHLVVHFFNDITHFDGKFFTSLKDLLFKPGFLPLEYARGRRASYLNPVRMYIFTSAIFFLLFFSFFYKDSDSAIQLSTINGKTILEINEMPADSFAAFTSRINAGDDKPAVPMTREEFDKYQDSVLNKSGFHFTGRKYRSRAEYDSLLASGEKKHNWIERQLIYKEISLNEKYHNSTNEVGKAFKNTLFHSLPQMLFISLPLLALILHLLYRRRKEFYYVSHGIFSINLYIFIFIVLLVLFFLNSINSYLHWGFISLLVNLFTLWIFVYEYLAMKNFYRQGWLKTLVKFLLLNILFIFTLSVLFAIFVFFSLFKI